MGPIKPLEMLAALEKGQSNGKEGGQQEVQKPPDASVQILELENSLTETQKTYEPVCQNNPNDLVDMHHSSPTFNSFKSDPSAS